MGRRRVDEGCRNIDVRKAPSAARAGESSERLAMAEVVVGCKVELPESDASIAARPLPERRCQLQAVAEFLTTSVILTATAPLIALACLLVRLTSPGPVFYTQKRLGTGGRSFTIYKIRTMYQDSEPSGPMWSVPGDRRVTAVGRFLRWTHVDELPQLINVLQGDMSLVGPRPPLQSEYARFTDRQRAKLAVKPGITCLWQVSGRNEITDFDEWLRLDLEYIERWSLRLDVAILLRTIPAVLSGRGAS